MKELTHYNYRIINIGCGKHNEQLGSMYLIQEQKCYLITQRWFKRVDPPELYKAGWSESSQIEVPMYKGNWIGSTYIYVLHADKQKAEETLSVIIAARKMAIVKEATV